MGTRLKLTDRNQPVVGVSYEDAAAFCAWLTERGIPYSKEVG